MATIEETDIGLALAFSSGRCEYVHDGLISISADLSSIGFGRDGEIPWPPARHGENALTATEAIELADHMIDRWVQFRAALVSSR